MSFVCYRKFWHSLLLLTLSVSLFCFTRDFLIIPYVRSQRRSVNISLFPDYQRNNYYHSAELRREDPDPDQGKSNFFLHILPPVETENPMIIETKTLKIEKENPKVKVVKIGEDLSNEYDDSNAVNLTRHETNPYYYKIIVWNQHTWLANVNAQYKKQMFRNCSFTNCVWTERTLLDRDKSNGMNIFILIPRNGKDPELEFPPEYLLKNNSSITVFFNREPPAHLNIKPGELDFKFDLTMTYRLDSDIPIPWGTFQPSVNETGKTSQKWSNKQTNYNELRRKAKWKGGQLFNLTRENLVKRGYTNLSVKNTDNSSYYLPRIAWFASNCKAHSKREAIVKKIQEFLPVDIYGKCGDAEHICRYSDRKWCVRDILKAYKFYLSFENSVCPEYVTEKVYEIMNYNVIPIVFGGADYVKLLPRHSFIDTLSEKFDGNILKVARYLFELDRDPERFIAYFEWKLSYEVKTNTGYWCDLCRYLTVPKRPLSHHLSSINSKLNFSEWWYRNHSNKCSSVQLINNSIQIN